jgi:hypothetical protein
LRYSYRSKARKCAKEEEDKCAPPREGVLQRKEPWRAGNENEDILATSSTIGRDYPAMARATEAAREINHRKRKAGQ